MADDIKLTLEPFEDENKHELDSAVQAAVQAGLRGDAPLLMGS